MGIHTSGSPCAVTSRRREQWPIPRGRSPVGWRDATKNPQIWLSHQGQQTLIATTLCSDSQLSGHYPSLFDQRWHSPDLATEDKYPPPGLGSIHTTTIPTVANSNVSKTRSLMSCILYTSPVTSNVYSLRCPPRPSRGEKFNTVWSCSVQSCSCSKVVLFIPSGRIRATTQGEAEQIKIVSCAELFCSELFGQSHIAVCALWEN